MFQPPHESRQTFIERVVGLPGDEIQIVDGQLIRHGRREQDPGIDPCGGGPHCSFRTPVVIPPDEYFMMGDHRGGSLDSRFRGPVPGEWLIGVAFFTCWPPNRVGTL